MIKSIHYIFVMLQFLPFQVFAEVKPAKLANMAAQNISQVIEFDFIQKTAEQMGVKVYLFGGSAAAYAHYVRWDLERLNGDTKHQPERFDYDFTNIYRGNQDLDLVVDGTEEQAIKLQRILQKEYPHFVGDKQSWEVRLLRHAIGDKLPLLDDPDFRNQHTDTNSTGMLDLTASKKEPVFRDLLDWENEESQFLKDVASARITYLFNEEHESTTRFQQGKNPAIFSAVRYLAKLTQYEVQGTKEDLETVQDIIDQTNFLSLSDYVKFKLKEFAIKTLLNSPNSEYAWNLMDDLGLREKLIKMDGNQTQKENSLSWWLSKEPLRTKEFGQSGRTAQEIFKVDEIIVSHETNSFLAYENITRSSRGEANAFISREGIAGEAAVHGDGFYTRKGQIGARGTGLTIRFRLHPEAREGHDFKVSGDFIIINNKKALTLIQENINISMIDFLKLSRADKIGPDDKGLSEKFLRKFKRMSYNSDEFQEALKFVSNIFSFSDEMPEELSALNMNKSIVKFDQLYELYVNGMSRYFDQIIVPSFTNNFQIWANNPDLVKSLIEKDVVTEDIVKSLLSKKEFSSYPEIVLDLVKKDKYVLDIINYVVAHEYWMSNEDFFNQFIDIVLKNQIYEDQIIRKILTHNYWRSKPEYVLSFLQKTKYPDSMIEHIFSKPGWAGYADEIEKYYMTHKRGHHAIAKYLLDTEEWRHRTVIFKDILSRKVEESEIEYKSKMAKVFFSSLTWMENNEILEEFIKQPSLFDSIVVSIVNANTFDSVFHQAQVKALQFIIVQDQVDSDIRKRIIDLVEQNKEWRKYYYEFLMAAIKIDTVIGQQFLIKDGQRLSLRMSIPLNQDQLYNVLVHLLKNKNQYIYMARNEGFFRFKDPKRNEFIFETLLEADMMDVNMLLVGHLMPKTKLSRSARLIEKILDKKNPKLTRELLVHVLGPNENNWSKHPQIIKKILEQDSLDEDVYYGIAGLFINKTWEQHYDIFIEIIRSKKIPSRVIEILSFSYVSLINNSEIMEALIESPLYLDTNSLLEIFLNRRWKYNNEILKKYYEKVHDKRKVFEHLFEVLPLSNDFIISAIKQIEKPQGGLFSYMKSRLMPDSVSSFIVNNLLLKKRANSEILMALVERETVNIMIDKKIFSDSQKRYNKELIRELTAFLGKEPLTTANLLKKSKKVNFSDWLQKYRGVDKQKSLQCSSILN